METAVHVKGMLRKAQEQTPIRPRFPLVSISSEASRNRHVKRKPRGSFHGERERERRPRKQIPVISEMIMVYGIRERMNTGKRTACKIIMHYKNTVFVW